MAVCLDYQTVYSKRKPLVVSTRVHLFAAVCLLLALVVKVWFKVECTELGYDIAKLRAEAEQYDMERRELELHRSVLLRPDELAARAHARLGLQMLDPNRARRVIY